MRYWPLPLGGSALPVVSDGVKRIDADHLAQRRRQVLGVAARLDVAGADVVGIAAVAEGQIQIAIRAEGDRAAVVIAGVLAERNDLAAASGSTTFGLAADIFHSVMRFL